MVAVRSNFLTLAWAAATWRAAGLWLKIVDFALEWVEGRHIEHQWRIFFWIVYEEVCLTNPLLLHLSPAGQ